MSGAAIAAQMYDLGERTTKDILEVADSERKFQEARYIARNAMQIRKNDLLAAGFNPALAYMSGGATEAVPAAYSSSSSSNAVEKVMAIESNKIQQANSAAQIALMSSQEKKADQEVIESISRSSLNSAQELETVSRLPINKAQKDKLVQEVLTEKEKTKLTSAQEVLTKQQEKQSKAQVGLIGAQTQQTKENVPPTRVLGKFWEGGKEWFNKTFPKNQPVPEGGYTVDKIKRFIHKKTGGRFQ